MDLLKIGSSDRPWVSYSKGTFGLLNDNHLGNACTMELASVLRLCCVCLTYLFACSCYRAVSVCFLQAFNACCLSTGIFKTLSKLPEFCQTILQHSDAIYDGLTQLFGKNPFPSSGVGLREGKISTQLGLSERANAAIETGCF
jgi:hypothetical protein